MLVKQQWIVFGFVSLVCVALLLVPKGSAVSHWGYGVLCCLVPVLFALRMYLRYGSKRGLAGVWLVELLKVALTIAALLAAAKVFLKPDWLAVVLGFVSGQVMSWLAMWLAHLSVSKVDGK